MNGTPRGVWRAVSWAPILVIGFTAEWALSSPVAGPSTSAPRASVAAANAQTTAPATAPKGPTPALSPEQIRASAQARVFQLVTRVRGGEDKRSYGTAFVVQNAGWLLTNFHVVSGVLLDPVRYGLELDLGDKTRIPASIEAIDVVNDLALVRVAHVFTSSYQLAVSPPAPGEKLYSLGLPQDTVMTIIEGLYSDSGRMGPLSRSLMSAPLNHGMSGGPVVNVGDELVGVNDAILPDAQSISVLVPAAAIADFLGRSSRDIMTATGQPSDRAPATALASAMTDVIPAQVETVLKPWVAQWKGQAQSAAFSTLGAYQIAPPPSGLKCWEDSKSAGNLSDARTRVCSTLGNFPILPGHLGGQLTLRYSNYPGASGANLFGADSRTMNRLFSGSLLFELYEQEASHRFAKVAASTDPDRKTALICHHRFLKNGKGVSLIAEYCASAVRPISGVYDLILTASPLGQSEVLIAELDLTGFTEAELLSASETFLDGIALTENEGAR